MGGRIGFPRCKGRPFSFQVTPRFSTNSRTDLSSMSTFLCLHASCSFCLSPRVFVSPTTCLVAFMKKKLH